MSNNKILAGIVAKYAAPSMAFPFSRKIGDVWYDIATDGHRILALETKEPHYSTEYGPKMDSMLSDLPKGPRFSVSKDAFDELEEVARACPRRRFRRGRGFRIMRLRHGKNVIAVVDADLLLGILGACTRKAVDLTFGESPISPIRIDGFHGSDRVIGVLMPRRDEDNQPALFEQLVLSFWLPDPIAVDVPAANAEGAKPDEAKTAAAE